MEADSFARARELERTNRMRDLAESEARLRSLERLSSLDRLRRLEEDTRLRRLWEDARVSRVYPSDLRYPYGIIDTINHVSRAVYESRLYESPLRGSAIGRSKAAYRPT